MPLPLEPDRKIRLRLDKLIEEVGTLLAKLDEYDREHYLKYQEWVVKTSGLLQMMFGDSKQGEKYQQLIERNTNLGQISGSPHHYMLATDLIKKVATLKGIRDNYVNGFYVSLEELIIANVSADYMEQAEALLGEGIQGQYDHVPAAVLCGAVLENRLRSYCENLDSPIETVKPNGELLTLGALIGKLDQVNAFDKQTRKLLRAWADIRNAAAHGRDDDFTREQVELMLLGVNGFLANHL